MERPILSVVIPAYNEAERVGATLSDIEGYFKSNNLSHEIIVVSDGSTDTTVKLVKDFQARMPNLRVIEYRDNAGKGHAVREGMKEARGTYRLFMDADNSVRIATVEPFLLAIRKGADIVIGSIAIKGSSVNEHAARYRRLLGSTSKFFIRIFVTPGIYDTQRGFKLFTADAADMLFQRQAIERYGFDIELLIIARTHNLQVKELAVEWHNPTGSKVGLVDYGRTFLELCTIISNKVRGKYRV